MSNALYTQLASDVSAILGEFGEDIQIYPASDPSDYTVKAVRSKRIRATVFDTQVREGDYEYIVEVGFVPKKGGRLVHGNDSFIIIDYEAIQPAAVVIAYYVWVRYG